MKEGATCLLCDHENQSEAKFCSNCGIEIEKGSKDEISKKELFILVSAGILIISTIAWFLVDLIANTFEYYRLYDQISPFLIHIKWLAMGIPLMLSFTLTNHKVRTVMIVASSIYIVIRLYQELWLHSGLLM
jgi:hypothetical protein